jgi:anti-sigma-K factor RskA
MTRELSHDEASESLAAAALDALAVDELAAVLAHAANCAVCGPELQSLRDAAAGLAFAAAPTPQSPEVARRLARIRERLLARAAADVAPSGAASTGGVPPDRGSVSEGAPGTRRVTLVPWLALAASVVIALVLYTQRGRLRDELARQDAGAVAALDSARQLLAMRDREIRHLTSPETEVVSLSEKGAQAATAHMFWDRADNSWTMYAHNMPPLPAGKTYELWLMTPTTKIPAGTFRPGADGSAEVRQQYALPRDSLRGVAVTVEPEGGVAAPTGPIVILGAPGGK